MERVKLGITIGDINGIGLEVILKAVSDKRILSSCLPIIYGSSKVVSYHKNIVRLEEFPMTSVRDVDQLDENAVNVINCWNDNVRISLGQITEEGGHFAFQSLEFATKDWVEGKIDALVTAPIHKKAMQLVGFPYKGHTEYLTNKTGTNESLMLMVHDELRVGVATNHIPISEVSSRITKELVLRKIELFYKTLRMDFGVDRPKIAVLGLNPHAGDEGAIGSEDLEFILPAVQEAQAKGWTVLGPYPADGFFGSGNYRNFDGILAMYHDQGLVPFKTLAFGGGVNYSAGLPFIRTSPDHGTGYNIAGQNVATPDSFLKAMYLAIDIVQQRANYKEMTANPIVQTMIEQSDDEILSDEEYTERRSKSHHKQRREQQPFPPRKERQDRPERREQQPRQERTQDAPPKTDEGE